MNLAQVKKSIPKLEKIRDVVEVSKFVTLQEIGRVASISKSSLQLSALARDVFMKASEEFKIYSRF